MTSILFLFFFIASSISIVFSSPNTFGIENFEFDPTTNSSGLDGDRTKFYRAGHGGSRPFYEITGYENDGELYRFTVRTFADSNCLILSDVVVVTLKKSYNLYDYAFVSVEITYSSGIECGDFST